MAIAELLDELFPIRIPAEAAESLSGFRAWVKSDEFPEKWRATFLRGEIVLDMSPEESETHTKVKWEIGTAIITLNKRLKLGTYYGDGVLLTNKRADLSTQPDGLFATKESLRSGRLRRVPRPGRIRQYTEFEGTPDLVLEIISRSSFKKDTEDLPVLYHRAGIPEYWLINALGDEIDFRIFRRGDRQYVPIEGEHGWIPSPLFARSFKLVRDVDQEDDWQYELRSKLRR
jgi:Uma2 family endonuclease